MANVKLSQITPSPSNVDSNTQFVAVEGGNTDLLFTPTQLVNGYALLRASVQDQVLSGGWNVNAYSYPAGSFVIDCGLSPLQRATNNASFSITAPGNDGQTVLQVVNGSTAGAITFVGFTVGNDIGDTLDTTQGHIFSIFIWRINGVSSYYVIAQQGGGGGSVGSPIAPVTSTVSEVSHLFKASAGTLYGAYAVNLTSATGFFLLLDQPSVPVDGSVTPLAAALLFPNSFASLQGALSTIPFNNGLVAVLTSATTPFTKTTTGGLTGYISCQYQ